MKLFYAEKRILHRDIGTNQSNPSNSFKLGLMETGVGIIGCGNISGIYVQNLRSFAATKVVAVADLDAQRAHAVAIDSGLGRASTVDELLENPDVELVVNLTVPKSHYSVARQAVDSGKHVYNEKPLCVNFEDGLDLAERARSNGVRIGCAPDTVLGAGVQTCRELIDAGVIGRPVAGQAFMMCAGHESWHPDPAFYYEKGGGPLFDMGPYYLSALACLLGPAQRVTGSAKVTYPTRLVTSQPKHGQEIRVETPTHLSTVIDYADGAMVQLTTSFDVIAHSLPHIEIYGSEGSLRVPDPNGFGGPVQIWKKDEAAWTDVSVVRPYSVNSRGLGVLDMALAIREGREHRANGDVGLHVLEIMHAAHNSSFEGRHIELTTKMSRPEAMPQTEF